MLEEVGPRLKMAGTHGLAVCQELHMPVLEKGRPQAKVLDLLTVYICNEHKVEMERKRKGKKKKAQNRTAKNEIEGKMQGWKREKQRYQNLLFEGHLSPARATNNNQKTKVVGFLNSSIFTSPETTLKGLEELRKHFCNQVAGYQWACWLNTEQSYSGRSSKNRGRGFLD